MMSSAQDAGVEQAEPGREVAALVWSSLATAAVLLVMLLLRGNTALFDNGLPLVVFAVAIGVEVLIIGLPSLTSLRFYAPGLADISHHVRHQQRSG